MIEKLNFEIGWFEVTAIQPKHSKCHCAIHKSILFGRVKVSSCDCWTNITVMVQVLDLICWDAIVFHFHKHSPRYSLHVLNAIELLNHLSFANVSFAMCSRGTVYQNTWFLNWRVSKNAGIITACSVEFSFSLEPVSDLKLVHLKLLVYCAFVAFSVTKQLSVSL